jgi:hypothetical protein
MTINDVVIAVMARAPSADGKTRLLGALGVADGEPLRRALLLDTLETVARVDGASRVILYAPDGAAEEFRRLMPLASHLIPQRQGDLGQRLAGAFDDLRALGFGAAAILGSDLPTLPASYLALAVDRLRQDDGQGVIGPAADGGYYLIGLTQAPPGLFAGMPWGTDRVLRLTRDRAASLGLDLVVLPEWHDVDVPEDLARVFRHAGRGLAGLTARHTRAWVDSAPPNIRARLRV